MLIYWLDNGKRSGPASVPDVISMIELGELSRDTLGWHSGCDNWLPLEKLPALADYLSAQEQPPEPPEPPAPPAPEPANEPAETDGPRAMLLRVMLPQPMMRFMARVLDMSLYAAVALSVLYMLHAPFSYYYHPCSIIFWTPMILLEALMIYLWQTTPGKKLLGIHIQGIKKRISFHAALLRSMLVFFLGMGCMYPILTLVMLGLSYMSVCKRGVTLWDVASGSVPVASSLPTAGKYTIIAITIFILFQLSMNCMIPWLPDMMNDLREQAPRITELLESMMPPQ